MAEHSAFTDRAERGGGDDSFNEARLTEAHQTFLHQMRQQRQARKSRSVHTINSSVLNPSIRSPEVFAQREAIRRAVQDEEDAQANSKATISKHGLEIHTPPSRKSEPQLTSVVPRSLNACITSIHGSMEDIHRPKNFRSDAQRRQSEPAPTVTTLNMAVSEGNISVSSIGSSFKSAKDGNGSQESDEDNTDMGDVLSISGISSFSHAESVPYYDERSLNLLRLPVQHFLAGGIRAQALRMSRHEAELYNYKLKNAIRHLSNSLLLNSRRSHRTELLRVRGDTSQLKLQESNLTLQLRVTRHVQANEREKSAEHDHQLQELRSQMANLQKTEKRTLYEIRSTEEDLQTTKADGATLHTEKLDLKREVDDALERKEALENLLDAERQNREGNANLCSNLERQICDLQSKIKDLTRQTNQWKERAAETEAKGLQMKQKLDLQASDYGELKKQYEVQHEQMLTLAKDITINEETLESIEDTLEFSIHEHNIETQELDTAEEELKVQEKKIKCMQKTSEKLRQEIEDMKKEVKIYKTLERRRQKTILNGMRFWLFVLEFFFFGPDVFIRYPSDVYSRAFFDRL